ncbi:MAG: hypothetical protein QM675_01760 [Protaetiibacter sp.]
MPKLLLMGSAFLPPSVLEPLAASLGSLGHEVTVASPWEPAGPEEALGVYAAALADLEAPILVAHSNAGNYVPLLLPRHQVAGVVFVDAVLPPLAGGAWRVVPEELADHVDSLSEGDRALPWTRWWARDEMVGLFPSEAAFEEVDNASPWVPKSYFRAELDAPGAWARSVTGAYLAFGDTYADELARASAYGWPVDVLPLSHLGVLGQPDLVASAVERLLGRPTEPRP